MITELCNIVPSRSRPHNIERMVQAWYDTEATSKLMVMVDEDDPTLDGYFSATDGHTFAQLIVGPHEGLVATLNRGALSAAQFFPYVSFMGDDHLPQSLRWDQRFRDVLFGLKTGFVWGNDLHEGELLPTAIWMTSNIIKRLGYMATPTFRHMYVDLVWRDWGDNIGFSRYLEDVVIEHLNASWDKAPTDAQYESTWPLIETERPIYDAHIAGDEHREIAELRQLASA